MGTTYCLGLNIQFVTETCCHDGCDINFAIPETWRKQKMKDHTSFYCPNGHEQCYTGTSDIEKLQKELAMTKRYKEHCEADVARKRRIIERERRRTAAYKGHYSRLQKRIAHGVCPCCTRTFKNVMQHIRCKHPEFVDKLNDLSAKGDGNEKI